MKIHTATKNRTVIGLPQPKSNSQHTKPNYNHTKGDYIKLFEDKKGLYT